MSTRRRPGSRPPQRFVVHPAELRLVAHRLQHLDSRISYGWTRLDRLLAATSLGRANPGFEPAAFERRHRTLVRELQRSRRSVAGLSELAWRTSADAVSADQPERDVPATLTPSLGQRALWTAALRTGRSAQTVASTVFRLAEPLRRPSATPEVGHRARGDRGGTYSVRQAGRWRTRDGTAVIAQALAVVGDPAVLAPDEFGLVVHDTCAGDPMVTVILPGVTDLSEPSPGLASDHSSVRDLDMAALPSAATGGQVNHYANMVSAALVHLDLPTNSKVNLIGHSYGAATAMTLAEDPSFNGGRYQVRSVVAAGYYLDDRQPVNGADTAVLILESENDLVVTAAAVALSPINGSRSSVLRFDGGGDGFGHHPANYQRFVSGSTSDRVRHLTARIDDDGFTGGGSLWAVDVSVPEAAGHGRGTRMEGEASSAAPAWRAEETSDKNGCHGQRDL